MAIVNLPLVPQIVDGQVIDAVPVMALANYIAAQVNANAQPLSVLPTTEWVALGATPSYISATSFSVPGNLTATLLADLRLQTTNTGGTIYSSVLTATFGGGLTTVTVNNDSGVLDSGIANVNVSIQNPVNLSQPQRSAVVVSHANGTNLTSGTTFILGDSLTPVLALDLLSEFATGTGIFTARQKGTYRIFVQMCISITTSTNLTALGNLQILVNGSSYAQVPVGNIPSSGSAESVYTYYMETIVQLAAAGTLQAKLIMPTFTGGPPTTYASPTTTPVLLIQRIA